MTESAKLRTQAIGAAGELLVQYKLLKLDIDSARLTTDSGIDLVMYVPGSQQAHTVQVKTQQKPVPAGGTGKPIRSWYFPHDLLAQWLALVDLSTDRVWLFTRDEACRWAQQLSPGGIHQIYWYPDESTIKNAHAGVTVIADYRLEAVVPNLLQGDPGVTA